MPTARSMPSSRVRSCTDSASVLTMPSRATITDSASSANTSPSSWLTASACLSLNCSIESASVCGKAFSAASALVASSSVVDALVAGRHHEREVLGVPLGRQRARA